MVDVNAGELLYDCLDEKCGNDRRINDAGKCEQHLPLTDLGADFLDLLLDKRICKRFRCDTLHSIGVNVSWPFFSILFLTCPAITADLFFIDANGFKQSVKGLIA